MYTSFRSTMKKSNLRIHMKQIWTDSYTKSTQKICIQKNLNIKSKCRFKISAFERNKSQLKSEQIYTQAHVRSLFFLNRTISILNSTKSLLKSINTHQPSLPLADQSPSFQKYNSFLPLPLRTLDHPTRLPLFRSQTLSPRFEPKHQWIHRNFYGSEMQASPS